MNKFVCSKKGFTLIEVLISMFILGIIGLILADLLANSFKNNVGIQLTSKLKQNGQISLNIMDRTIRSSDRIICVGNDTSGTANRTIVVLKDDVLTRFIMVAPSASQNGYILQDNPSSTNLDLSEPTQVTPICNPAALPPDGVPLTNQDVQGGVSLISGNFIPQGEDAVQIIFQLRPAIQSGITTGLGSTFADFQTTIQLR